MSLEDQGQPTAALRQAVLHSLEDGYAPLPDVLGLRGGHVHIQVADIGFLRVGLQTLLHPEGLTAWLKRVGDKHEPYITKREKIGQKRYIIDICDDGHFALR